MSPLTPNIIIRAKCLFKSPSRVRVCHFSLNANSGNSDSWNEIAMPVRTTEKPIFHPNKQFVNENVALAIESKWHTHTSNSMQIFDISFSFFFSLLCCCHPWVCTVSVVCMSLTFAICHRYWARTIFASHTFRFGLFVFRYHHHHHHHHRVSQTYFSVDKIFICIYQAKAKTRHNAIVSNFKINRLKSSKRFGI